MISKKTLKINKTHVSLELETSRVSIVVDRLSIFFGKSKECLYEY